MSYLLNNEQKLNDLIFAHRNKNYGAYEIRSSYGHTIAKSLAIMLLGFGSMFSTAFYLSHRGNEPEQATAAPFIHDTVYVIPFDNTAKQDKTVDKKLDPPAPARETKNNDNHALTVVDSVLLAKKESTTETTVTSGTTSTITSGGTDTNSLTAGGNGTTTTGGKGKTVKGAYEVDSQPEFEGGLSALYHFISSHMRYPARASEEGVEGVVYVKFVVDESGEVGSLSLLNHLGYGLDEEAARVVSMIPKFKKPAMAQGEAVKVYFQLPIRYRLR
ncbi:MAG: energy transducer TonB [bacterium]|nr:energy transducer TonB [bacterium]